MIIKKMVVGPLQTNCYIIVDEKSGKGIIIDPGYDASKIIKQVGLCNVDVIFIVLSHGHIDHICALSEIKRATNAKVAIHRKDAPLLEETKLGVYLGIECTPIPRPDIYLEGGEEFKLGKLIFRIIHTAGHTPGGICLEGEGACFTGDTLFRYGIGRSDLPGGNSVSLINNIRQRLLTLPDQIKVYPGHGPETTIEAERRGNPFI